MMMAGRLLDATLVSRAGSTRTRDLFAVPRALLRVLRNRREIGSLEEFSDYQLADIGLTRDILRASMDNGRFDDPSGYLTDVVRQDRLRGRRSA